MARRQRVQEHSNLYRVFSIKIETRIETPAGSMNSLLMYSPGCHDNRPAVLRSPKCLLGATSVRDDVRCGLGALS